jgi:hypothetical protein
MDFREGQLVKTSTNRLGRSTILTLSEPCRRSGSMVTILGKGAPIQLHRSVLFA